MSHDTDSAKTTSKCKFLAFRSNVAQVSVLVEYDTVSLGNEIPTIRKNVVVSKRLIRITHYRGFITKKNGNLKLNTADHELPSSGRCL
jgi:hypothetical protein